MKWQQRNTTKFDQDDILGSLLKARGIKNSDEFLNPTSKVLHNPMLLGNIGEACERILKAIKNGERIAISADCDSDGVFSTAIMARYLSKFTDNYYITYNQRSEGHGVENQLDKVEDGTSLIIVLDSSTNSVDACATLRDRGIDVVILDHHDHEKNNPHALIVNPKLDDTYPNKFISGAGVVYKVVQVLDESLGSGEVDEYIDLVACGMYADMMPVDVPENRYMIIQGMKNIKNMGLQAILKVNSIEHDSINSQTIGFTISPLINGAARKDEIQLGIDLLTCDDWERCVHLVVRMKELNEERKAEEKELFEKYVTKINPEDKILVAIDEEASKNFNGLIANKIAQEFKRPAIVMREHEGSLAGSYRGYAGFDMRSFLNQKPIRKLLKYAVGHPGAGGIGLKASNYPKFSETVNNLLKDIDFRPSFDYDFEIDARQVTTKMINEIAVFDYLTGEGFPTAKFLIKNLFVEENPKVMGKNRDTVRISCKGMDVMKFKVNDQWASEVGELDYIEVIGQLKVNEFRKWNGDILITNQVLAEDYKIS